MMADDFHKRIQEIRKRRATITDAPWVAVEPRNRMPDEWGVTSVGDNVNSCSVAQIMFRHEAEFVAHAPEDIDFLLAEVIGKEIPRRPRCEVCGIGLTSEDLRAGRCPYCKNSFSEFPSEATNE